MKIVCTSNVVMAEDAFGTLGDVRILSPQQLTRSAVRDADVLVVRSGTTIDRDLLEGSRVCFVGTATAGTDHMNHLFLEEAGIAWCAAPGCNANSVVEYVVSALLALGHKHGLVFSDLTLGVIGVGHIGSLVAKVAECLGMRVLLNDPPQKMVTGKASFISLRKLLCQCDVVTMHVPLTRGEPYPTAYMANHRFFRHIKPGCLLINTSRGEIVDSDALMLALQRGMLLGAVLDTWDNEPYYPLDLLDAVDIGTCHIAGHSYEGKLGGTAAVYNEVCHFLEAEPTWDPYEKLPAPITPEVAIDAMGLSDEEALYRIVKKVYDIEADSDALRESAEPDPNTRAANFIRLRLEYPARREFTATKVVLKNGTSSLREKLAGLGFLVIKG